MPRTIPPDSLEFRVDRVSTGYGSTDFTVPGADIAEFQASQRAGRPTDEGKLVIYNDDFAYTTGGTQLDIGDRIGVVDKAGSTSGFGDGGFGDGPFGGSTRIGTYMVLDWDIVGHGGHHSDISLKIADFVFSILSNRRVWRGFTGESISGSEDAVLNEILRDRCPEIDRSRLPVISETIDYHAQGTVVRKAVDELAAIASDYVGPILQTSATDALRFVPINDLSPVSPDPLPTRSFGPLSVASESHNLTNWVRISGGIDAEGNIDDQQTTVANYQTVSKSDPLIVQTKARKPELPEIEVYTYNSDGSTTTDNGVRIRLQASNDAGDGPVAPSDTDSDLVTGQNRKVALDPDGFTSWILGDHTIHDQNPWLIIDSGDSGTPDHQIGVDSNGVPAYKAHFAKRIEAVQPDRASIDQYGERDNYVERKSLASREAVREVARSHLDRHAHPDLELGPIPALNGLAHDLDVGDVVPFDRPGYRAQGDFIVTKREDRYEGATLYTDLTFRGIDTYV